MKKKISFFGIIIFIIISTISLVACNDKNKINKYTKEELIKLKEKNNINTKYGILEWMTPQEKPFKKIDNKYYFTVWRGNKNNNWKGIKFQINKKTINPFIIDKDGNRNLEIADLLGDLVIIIGLSKYLKSWINDNGTYFKSVYHLNLLNKKEFNLDIYKDGNIKI